jgi:F-type H+-transporting ATPase subunit epsilon
MAVGEGLVEVTGSITRILTDVAIDADKIDEKAAEEAIARAQKTLSELKPGEHQEEVAAAMAAIQRATANLGIKRKRRTV